MERMTSHILWKIMENKKVLNHQPDISIFHGLWWLWAHLNINGESQTKISQDILKGIPGCNATKCQDFQCSWLASHGGSTFGGGFTLGPLISGDFSARRQLRRGRLRVLRAALRRTSKGKVTTVGMHLKERNPILNDWWIEPVLCKFLGLL